MPLARVVRAMDAVAVALAGTDAGQVAVPVVGSALLDVDDLLAALGVEQAQFDLLGALGEQREVGALAVRQRAERERVSWPDAALGHLTSAPAMGGTRTPRDSTRVPETSVPTMTSEAEPSSGTTAS